MTLPSSGTVVWLPLPSVTVIGDGNSSENTSGNGGASDGSGTDSTTGDDGTVAGLISPPGMGAYAASKAAVTQLSRCLGLELAPHGIRVNIISPGSTDTPMQQAMWAQGSSRETVIAGSGENYRLGIPLQKIATPEEIAEAVLFLLSDRASHITLSDLRVDGGATLDQG